MRFRALSMLIFSHSIDRCTFAGRREEPAVQLTVAAFSLFVLPECLAPRRRARNALHYAEPGITGQSLPALPLGCKWSSAARQSLSCRTRNGRMQGVFGMAAPTALKQAVALRVSHFERKKNDAATAVREPPRH